MLFRSSEKEGDTETMRQINQELTAGIQGQISAGLLTELWDNLESLGPGSRAFVARRRFELLEYLGGPIKL